MKHPELLNVAYVLTKSKMSLMLLLSSSDNENALHGLSLSFLWFSILITTTIFGFKQCTGCRLLNCEMPHYFFTCICSPPPPPICYFCAFV